MPDAKNLDGLPFEERIAARYGVDEGRLGDLRSAVESRRPQSLTTAARGPERRDLTDGRGEGADRHPHNGSARPRTSRLDVPDHRVAQDGRVLRAVKTLNDYGAPDTIVANTAAERMAQVTAQIDAGLHAAARRWR